MKATDLKRSICLQTTSLIVKLLEVLIAAACGEIKTIKYYVGGADSLSKKPAQIPRQRRGRVYLMYLLSRIKNFILSSLKSVKASAASFNLADVVPPKAITSTCLP